MEKSYLLRKGFLWCIFFVCISTFIVGCKTKKEIADKDTQNWRYELECAGNGASGTYLVKVWSYSKKPRIAMEQAKKNAVHGVIFKGFSSKHQGCHGQSALTVNQPGVQHEKADFFYSFFADGGDYMRYVSVVDGTYDQIKVGKEYKVGMTVSVSQSMLRKDLQAAGVLKSLNDGF